jgi:hypothetical protein
MILKPELRAILDKNGLSYEGEVFVKAILKEVNSLYDFKFRNTIENYFNRHKNEIPDFLFNKPINLLDGNRCYEELSIEQSGQQPLRTFTPLRDINEVVKIIEVNEGDGNMFDPYYDSAYKDDKSVQKYSEISSFVYCDDFESIYNGLLNDEAIRKLQAINLYNEVIEYFYYTVENFPDFIVEFADLETNVSTLVGHIKAHILSKYNVLESRIEKR